MNPKVRNKERLNNMKRERCKEELMIRLIKKNLIKKRQNFREMNLKVGVVLMISNLHFLNLKRKLVKIKNLTIQKNNNLINLIFN
jgi:hypothetical protein